MQFSTAVHNNNDLSVADKFNYLSTLVAGRAAAISGLQEPWESAIKMQWTFSRDASEMRGLSYSDIFEAS